MNKCPLPPGMFDGQEFIDAFRIKWVYSAETGFWVRTGRIDSIPLADQVTTGLLDRGLKSALDQIPNKAGGYAIITRPFLSLRSQSNPDGLLFGDVTLRSDSLDIKCVFSDGRPVSTECSDLNMLAFCETDDDPPGFDLSFKESLLNTLCVEVPGGPGLPGRKGEKGDPGEDGYGDGPQGEQGDPGEDALEHHTLSGVRVVDVDDIFDTAIVKLELDQDAGKLFVTKARMNLPDDEDAAAQQLIAQQISRDVSFTVDDCFEYELLAPPCNEDDPGFDEVNPVIAYYPEHYDPSNLDKREGPRKYILLQRRLSDLVNDITGYYKDKLDEIAESYDKQIREFLIEKDAEARKQLDVLGDRLAECENITYLEYCLAPTDCRGESTLPGQPSEPPVVDVPSDRPECESVAIVAGCPGGSCQVLSTPVLKADVAPIFSFDSPGPPDFGGGAGGSLPPGVSTRTIRVCDDDAGCPINIGGGSGFVPKGGRIPTTASLTSNRKIRTETICVDRRNQEIRCPSGVGGGGGNTQLEAISEWASEFRSAISRAGLIYHKTQLKSGPNQTSFPAGTYAFLYTGGAVRQQRSPSIPNDLDESRLINGGFQQYYVGNEGGIAYSGPYYIINGESQYGGSVVPFRSLVAQSIMGLQVGFAPASYRNLLPDSLFERYKFDPLRFSGNAFVERPLSTTDFSGTTPSSEAAAEERKITWKAFDGVDDNADKNDASSVEQAYLSGPIQNRMVYFTTSEPGFFFARIRTAYSIVNYLGDVVMPPEKTGGTRPISTNIAGLGFVSEANRPSPLIPMVNAFPVADGQINIKVMRISCPTEQSVPEVDGTAPAVDQITGAEA